MKPKVPVPLVVCDNQKDIGALVNLRPGECDGYKKQKEPIDQSQHSSAPFIAADIINDQYLPSFFSFFLSL
jgi:hypothetical protein